MRRAGIIILVGIVAASTAMTSCKPREKGPPEETSTEAPSQFPSPVSKGESFAIGDDVSILDDDGRFEIDVRVVALSDKPKGYSLRIGSGRAGKTKVLPAQQVFPAPWASAARVKVGDTIYQRSFGNFAPYKCVVTDVSGDLHSDIKAKCGTDALPRLVHRQDTFYAFEPVTSATTLTPGEIVYYENKYWAMVVGQSDAGDRIAIRATGFGQKDQLAPLSKIQRVR